MVRPFSFHSERSRCYHDHPDCKLGKRILPDHMRPGKGGKKRCLRCARLANGYTDDYGDATPEQVAEALLKYRPHD